MKKNTIKEKIKQHSFSLNRMQIVRYVSLLLFGFVVNILASAVSAQDTRISIEANHLPVREVLKMIETKSDYHFAYNNKLIDVTRKVDIHATNERISDILKRIFKGTDVISTVIDHQIVLASAKSMGEVQGDSGTLPKVSGKVTDSKGQALPGVTVMVQGTSKGTITDANGMYTLQNIRSSQTLEFSFIGMQKSSVLVGDHSVINVKMVETATGLNEVVVTALGIKRSEKALGYAVQVVPGNTLQTVKGVDVGTSLTGKVAGLLVENSTEFTQEPTIQIRGENPILVIDGVPYTNMSLGDVPSDDIASISVLKGATASALYGYRGASGAIMITTKKGSSKKGLTVSFNSGTMMTAGFLAIPKVQTKYGRVINTATNTYARTADGAWGVPMDGRQVIQWDPISKTMKSMPYLPIGKNNFQNYLEQGYVLNNNVSMTQQGELGSLRASATWIQNKGQYPNSMFNKITYDLGGEMKLDKFSLSSSLSYTYQNTPNMGFRGYTGYDPMYSMLIWSAPDYDIRQYKDYWLVPNESQNDSYVANINNPYFDAYQRTHSEVRNVFDGTLALSYELTPWLKASLRTGFDTYNDQQEIKISEGSMVSAGSATVLLNGNQVWGESAKGSFNYGLGQGYSINNDLMLTGKKSIGDFTIDGLLGTTLYYYQDEGMEAMTQGGLSVPGFYSLAASINPVAVDSRIYRQQVNSLYGRLAVSWKDLIYADGTVRNDWSSTLPASTRSYLYPSASASFIVSELLPKMRWLSLWKLRGSWTSSKTPAGVYDINSVYSITNNVWGELTSATYPTTIVGGTNVKPQAASTMEFGTAASLFGNKVSFDVAYYSKRMYDFLIAAGVSSATGFYSNYVNTSQVITRKGVEVSANFTPFKTNVWQWDLGLNWSTYADYYTKLDPLYSPDEPWVKEGARVDAYVLRNFQKDPKGNIIYSNGLPLYSAYNSKYGNSDPDWIWGLNTSLKYKNWSFNIALDGRVGGLMQSITEMYMWRAGVHPNSLDPARYLDVTNPGSKNYVAKGVKVVSGSATYDTYGNIVSDTRVYAPNDVAVTYESWVNAYHRGTAWGGTPSPVDVFNATFFKIRELALTYELPKTFCSMLDMVGASVSAVGQNVFLWAKQFKYSDPDGGSENFSAPSQRYLGVDIKVTF